MQFCIWTIVRTNQDESIKEFEALTDILTNTNTQTDKKINIQKKIFFSILLMIWENIDSISIDDDDDDDNEENDKDVDNEDNDD